MSTSSIPPVEGFDALLCAYCRKGTTLKHQVVEWSCRGASFHTHPACIDRQSGKPPARGEPRQNLAWVQPSALVRFAQWNVLAAEFADLWTRCWSGAMRASSTLQEACDSANSLQWSRTQMEEAFSFSYHPSRATTEPVRFLHWRIARLRDALDNDATHAGRRIKAAPRDPRDFTLPESVVSKGEALWRELGRTPPVLEEANAP
jgi:hypothetical protein